MSLNFRTNHVLLQSDVDSSSRSYQATPFWLNSVWRLSWTDTVGWTPGMVALCKQRRDYRVPIWITYDVISGITRARDQWNCPGLAGDGCFNEAWSFLSSRNSITPSANLSIRASAFCAPLATIRVICVTLQSTSKPICAFRQGKPFALIHQRFYPYISCFLLNVDRLHTGPRNDEHELNSYLPRNFCYPSLFQAKSQNSVWWHLVYAKSSVF